MAKVKKRGNSYQIDYLDPNGKRVRLSFHKKKDAVAELGKRVSLIAEKRYLDVKKDYKSTFKELMGKYEENYQDQKSYKSSKGCYFGNFKTYFGEDTRLANIRYVHFETYCNHLKKKLTRLGRIRKESSVNREMSCLRHMFAKAAEWEMIERNPFEKGKSLLMKENNKRMRYLSEDEIDRLLEACQSRKHLHRIVMCALHTGMRRAEILKLKWNQVRDGFIYLRETKTNESRQIPINDQLAMVFKEIRKEQGLSSEYVFTYKPNAWKLFEKGKAAGHIKERPLHRIERGFYAALEKAGIEDFRFHDLRHTFASHLIMKGASLKEVQELLGHKDIKMTMRYAHLSQENKKKAINLLNDLTTKTTCHKMSQIGLPSMQLLRITT
jgi:integrase